MRNRLLSVVAVCLVSAGCASSATEVVADTEESDVGSTAVADEAGQTSDGEVETAERPGYYSDLDWLLEQHLTVDETEFRSARTMHGAWWAVDSPSEACDRFTEIMSGRFATGEAGRKLWSGVEFSALLTVPEDVRPVEEIQADVESSLGCAGVEIVLEARPSDDPSPRSIFYFDNPRVWEWPAAAEGVQVVGVVEFDMDDFTYKGERQWLVFALAGSVDAVFAIEARTPAGLVAGGPAENSEMVDMVNTWLAELATATT